MNENEYGSFAYWLEEYLLARDACRHFGAGANRRSEERRMQEAAEEMNKLAPNHS